jgi:hypothetical protein
MASIRGFIKIVSTEVSDVGSVNSPLRRVTLRGLAPDAVVVKGTRIIKQNVAMRGGSLHQLSRLNQPEVSGPERRLLGTPGGRSRSGRNQCAPHR